MNPTKRIPRKPVPQPGQRRNSSKHHTIHWVIPGQAALSLLFAIALALGHHFFYLFWHHRPVSSDTQQQWIIRVGTAFAFLVSSLLVIAVSYSFTQQVWFSLGQRSAKVSEVDDIFSILKNVFVFANVKLWVKRPCLAITALIAWTVPIASIIPPGTLTVTSSQSPSNGSLVVATFNYSQVSNFMPEYSFNAGGIPVISNPGPELSRLSVAGLSSLTTFQQKAPATNCSFTMKLHAPTFSCQSSPQMMETFINATNAVSGGAMVQTATVLFFSWAPAENQNVTALLDTNNFNDYAAIDTVSTDSSHVYLYSAGPDLLGSLNADTQPAFIDCSLFNASYTLHFNFSNTVQTLSVLQRDLIGGVAANSFQSTDFYTITNGSSAVQDEYIAYVSLMTAFGNIMTGGVWGIQNHLTGSRDTFMKTLVMSTPLAQLRGTWSNETFAAVTEEMFQNMTLSLLSSNSFTADSDGSTQLENIVVSNSQNIYIYKPSSLLISYGVGIIVVVLVFGFGTFVLLRNGRSFNYSFSAILRTTRNADFSSILAYPDADGAEPCNDYLKDAKVIYKSDMPDGQWAGFIPIREVGVSTGSAEDIELTRSKRTSFQSKVSRLGSTNTHEGSYSRLHSHNDRVEDD